MNTEGRWMSHSNDEDARTGMQPLAVRIDERIAHNEKLIAQGVEALLDTVGSSGDADKLAFLRMLRTETRVLKSIRDNTIE